MGEEGLEEKEINEELLRQNEVDIQRGQEVSDLFSLTPLWRSHEKYESSPEKKMSIHTTYAYNFPRFINSVMHVHISEQKNLTYRDRKTENHAVRHTEKEKQNLDGDYLHDELFLCPLVIFAINKFWNQESLYNFI